MSRKFSKQRGALVGFAAGHAQLEQSPFREQRQGLGGKTQLIPAKTAVDEEYPAVCIPRRARSGTNRIVDLRLKFCRPKAGLPTRRSAFCLTDMALRNYVGSNCRRVAAAINNGPFQLM